MLSTRHRLLLSLGTSLLLLGAVAQPASAATTAPSAVTDLHVTEISESSVTLTWTAPASAPDGISTYLVEYLPAQKFWTTYQHAASSDTSITVTGLTLLTPYEFRVSAVSAADGSTTGPATIADFHVVKVDSGEFASCALMDDGTVQCWGTSSTYYGGSGLLGDGTQTDSQQPVLALIPERARDISVGSATACAIGLSGKVYCWGRVPGTFGGSGDPGSTTFPTVQPGLSDVVQVSAGNAYVYNDETNVCAITSGNDAYCWGFNELGQLGNGGSGQIILLGPQPHSTAPTRVSAPPGVGYTYVSASGTHTCFIGTDKNLYCTGDNNAGQLGVSPTPGPMQVPTLVSDLSDVVSVFAGQNYTCAVTGSGDLYCWGDNSYGQLGTGDTTSYVHPQKINAGWSATDVSGWNAGACALTTDKTLKCWGGGYDNGTPLPTAYTPTDTSPARTYTSVAGGGESICATSTDQHAYCWGYSGTKALGYGTGLGRGPSTPVDPYVDTLNTPAPMITSFSPLQGPVGTMVTVTGNYLAPVTNVVVNGLDVAFSQSSGSLQFQVPAGIPVGTQCTISVSSFGGTATSTDWFLVTTSPKVSIDLTVTSGGEPLAGGTYTWLSQDRFSPAKPIPGDDSGHVTLNNVIGGPGRITVTGATLPDGRTVSGSWIVMLAAGPMQLAADPPPAPPTVTAEVQVLFPDGSSVPGATVSALGITDSYSDVSATHSLTYYLPSAIVDAVTDTAGHAVITGYRMQQSLFATGSYVDGILNQTSLPVPLTADGNVATITLDYMPIVDTATPDVVAQAGDEANETFTVVNDTQPVPDQVVTLEEVTPPDVPAALVHTQESRTLSNCPTQFSARTNQAGVAVVSLCTNVAGKHLYKVVTPGAIPRSRVVSLTVSPAAPPSEPTHVTAVAGDRFVTVSWQAPDSVGSSPITSYRVTTSPGGATCTSATALTCRVSGLANGVRYTFTVVATSAVGDSRASAPSATATPYGLPAQVTSVKVAPAKTSIVVTWSVPRSSNGAAIAQYVVTIRQVGTTKVTAHTTSALRYTFTTLHSKTTYVVTVAARNKAGTGRVATATVKTK